MISPRILTGLALLIVVSTGLALGGSFLALLLLIVALIAEWEFFDLFQEKMMLKSEKILAMLLTVLMVTLAVVKPESGLMPFEITFTLLSLFFLFRWARNSEYSFTAPALTAAGLAYIPLMLLPALFCSLPEQILLIALPMLSDTVAWFIGTRWGKHKIWRKVSPNKSVEGSMAGLVAAICVSVCLGLSCGHTSILAYTILGIILGIMAQFGDFLESALKRAHNVKDSGSILPGHGGMLDRIDSMLLVIPTYCFCKTMWIFF